jgi:hypothetical protein
LVGVKLELGFDRIEDQNNFFVERFILEKGDFMQKILRGKALDFRNLLIEVFFDFGGGESGLRSVQGSRALVSAGFLPILGELWCCYFFRASLGSPLLVAGSAKT